MLPFSCTNYAKVPDWFHSGQRQAWESKALEVVCLAGAQGGKTCGAAHAILRELQRSLPLIMLLGSGKWIYAGPTMALLEAQAIPQFEALFGDIEQLGNLVKSPKVKFTFSRAGLQKVFGTDRYPVSVHFAYTNDSSNLESMTALGASWDEAGQKENKQESFDAMNRRLSVARSVVMNRTAPCVYQALVSDEDRGTIVVPAWWEAIYGADTLTFGRRFFYTTPYEWGWFKDKIVDKAPAFGIEVVNWPSWLNPVVSRKMCEAEKGRMPLWRWSMMWEGRFTRPAGVIYDCFDRARHVCKPRQIEEDWEIYAGIDFGPIHFAAVLAAREPSGHIHIIATYLAAAPNMRYHVRRLRQKAVLPIKRAWGGAPSEATDRADITRAGLWVEKPGCKGLETGINRTYVWFAQDRISIWEGPEHGDKLIEELERYSREVDGTGEPTEKIDDKSTFHRADALRYLCATLKHPLDVIPGRPYPAQYYEDREI